MGASRTKYERQFWELGYRLIAGLDEVGVGCLAGPVVAAAVIFSSENTLPRGIDDSKKFTAARRGELSEIIRARAVAWAIGTASVEEIDTINIYQAARLAMKRAVESLSLTPEYLLIDGRVRLECPVPQLSIIRGDQLSVSIGAASILAKVHRDQWMTEMDVTYPGYHFASHKGYGSVEHRRQLQALGPSPLHRKSFTWTPV